MVLKKKSRMSAPVVIIGWLLLIPSFLGILGGIIGLVAMGGGVSVATTTANNEAKTRLESAKIPTPIIDKVIAGTPVTDTEKNALTSDQQQSLADATTSINASRVGAGIGMAAGGTVSIAIIVVSFIGGLLGWLLVMKKKVLQCPACSTVIAAS
jgi:hypothetical protein